MVSDIWSITMNATQCKMARAGVGWRAQDLAIAAGVGYATVARFEAGAAIAPESLAKLVQALEGAGAMFLAGKGRVGVSVEASEQ